MRTGPLANGSAYYRCPKNLIIPSKVQHNGYEYTVIGIGYQSFSSCSTDNLTIPDTIKYIEFGGLDMMGFTEFSGLPPNIERIEMYGLSSNYYDHFHIPKSLTKLGVAPFCNLIRLKGFTVDPDNPSFCADEYGSLYNKQKTVLIHSPSVSYLEIAPTCEVIQFRAIRNPNLSQIVFPSSIKSIQQRAIEGSSKALEIFIIGEPEIDVSAFNNVNTESSLVYMGSKFSKTQIFDTAVKNITVCIGYRYKTFANINVRISKRCYAKIVCNTVFCRCSLFSNIRFFIYVFILIE